MNETLISAPFSMCTLGITGPSAGPKLTSVCFSYRKTGENTEIITQLFTFSLLPRFSEGGFPRKIRSSELDPLKAVKKTNVCWVISVASYCKTVVYRMASCALGNVVLMLTSTSPQEGFFNIIH